MHLSKEFLRNEQYVRIFKPLTNDLSLKEYKRNETKIDKEDAATKVKSPRLFHSSVHFHNFPSRTKTTLVEFSDLNLRDALKSKN